MACTRNYVTLRIFSGSLSVEWITRAMGTNPSKAWDRHEASRYPHQREWAGWMLSTKDESDIGSEAEHLDLLLDWLNDAKQPLAQIRAGGGQADARFFYEFLNQGGGPP